MLTSKYSFHLNTMFLVMFAAFSTLAKETITLTAFESCPYVCAQPNGNRGVLIDLVHEIFDQEQYQLEINIMPHSRALKMVQEGYYDGMVGVLQRENFELIYPRKGIGRYQYNFYTLAEDNWAYTGLQSLYQKRIAIQSGVSYGIFDSYIDRYKDNTNQIQKLHGQDVLNRMFKLMALKRVDLVVADKNSMEWSSNKNPELMLREAGSIPMDDIFIGFNVTKGNQLAEIVDQRMSSLRSSGRLARILAEYSMSDWEQWTTGDYTIFENNYLHRIAKNSVVNSSHINYGRVIKLRASVTQDSGYWHYATKFKELVENKTDGALTVTLEFGESSEHDIVYDLAEGKVAMGIVAINNFTPFAPSSGVFVLPYMFPSIASAKNLIKSQKMLDIANRSAFESGIRPISMYIGGYRTLLNNKKPIKMTTDLAGLKIRVPINQLMVETFRSWGVEPYPMSWPNVYPSLESGLIDGMENPLVIANVGIKKEKELWQYYQFATTIKYLLFMAPHLISEKLYASLSDEHRKALLESAAEAQTYSWQQLSDEESKLISLAKEHGMVFNQAQNERDDWESKAKSIWHKMYFRVGGKTHVEETQGALGEITYD